MFLFGVASVYGQGHNGLYGNEWIDYTPGKEYYKIKVFEDGMYRVSRAVLQQAGANTSSINLNGIQVFHEGVEIPVFIESTGGVLDYVQFYGKKNRGSFDVNMYNDPEHHFNERFSLFNDTASYFLTWGATASTKHFTERSANLSNLPPVEQYFMHENTVTYSSTWNTGKKHQISTELLTKSIFEFGEGFGSNITTSLNTNVPSEHPFSGGPNATATVKVYATSSGVNNLNLKAGNTTYGTFTIAGQKVAAYSASFPASVIQPGGTSINSSGPSHYLAYVDLEYPRTFDFDGSSIFPFKMAANNNRKYLNLENVDATNSGQNKYYLYDLTNSVRINGLYSGVNSMVVTDLTPSASERELVLINEGNPNSYTNVAGVNSVTFKNYSSSLYTSTNYLIITHSSLRSNSNGNNPIFDYRAYRQSSAGGGYITSDVDVQELYDQFSYGISNHALAIRHFVHFVNANWSNPEYVFLIGKGRDYQAIRGAVSNMLVPTFGYPTSDNVMLGSVNSDEPLIAVGRLAAENGDQVSLYLQKIIDTEAQRTAAQTLIDRGWTKNILHLGGGQNSGEQNLIRNHLNSMKLKIEAPGYGGFVESFFKTSSSPIQVVQSSYLDSLVNSGVSMITFFGHSSANSFDFNLDHPQNYNNYQKYPLIMALGCYGGTISNPTPKISEEFIFEPQAGAGVFLASVGASALSALNNFAQEFYTSVGAAYYNEGASKSVKEAIRVLQNGNYGTTIQMACNYMVYHGDPAYRLSNTEFPDYYIDETLVSHSPEEVTIQLGSFNLELDIYNLGKAVDSVINIRVDRILPGSNTADFETSILVNAPFHSSHVIIPIQIANSTELGLNKFNIYIDSDSAVNEQPAPPAEQNNSVLEYNVVITANSIVPVYPYEFSIVPDAPITLKASTGNAFAIPQTYIFQIDTTEYFNSPLIDSARITQSGGLVEWTPSISYMDSTVYYWRVSIDPASPSSWGTSSFMYKNGSYPGWNQSHYFQYLKDKRTNLLIEEPDRKFKYITSVQTVSAKTAKTPSVLHPENVALYFNGSKLEKCRCTSQNGIYVSVIEPGTLDFWMLPGYTQKYGAFNCDAAGRTTPTFLFKTQLNSGQDALESFIRDTVPDGHYVLAYTLNNAFAFDWGTGLIQAFEDQGAYYLDSFANNTSAVAGLPWATFFKKGDTTYQYNISEIGASENSIIDISGSLLEVWYQGNQTSTIIGPASNWLSFHWDHDYDVNDEQLVDIYGVDVNQNVRTLQISQANLMEPLTGIDANQYPYLELVWNNLDSVNKTSPYLKYWRVLGDMVPEAALRPDYFLYFDSSCVQEGQDIKLEIAMENISPVDMDSMLVKFELIGDPPVYKRLDSLRSGDTLHASVSFSTLNKQGNHQLLIEINPNNDQPEKYFFNNLGVISFEVKGDRINPLLDVTFDGVHIMNKDIVSGKPEIVIELSDNNQYLGLDDIEDFSVILRHSSFPNGEMALSPETTDLQFYPADNTKLGIENKAKIIIHPDLVSDGTYTLFVSAADQSGNNSGQLSYSVDFEVINKPSISHMLNYPNPFSTSTQFVFTLTGRELPNYMKIQILTVTGKVVREILQEELGTLRIGVNRTEYAWDGKDEFGDQLANGVYLYRVITKKDGADYDMYSNRNDFMFRQGFGKMYLMR